MGLNRDKFRNIVGGITTPKEADVPPAAEAIPQEAPSPPAGQGSDVTAGNGASGRVKAEDHRRFAKRGRPKARKDDEASAKGPKVKVSLFLSEDLVNDLYDWAHADRIHPGEMFERALRPFHDKEAKRRNAGKG
jgi:hypothetical protein